MLPREAFDKTERPLGRVIGMDLDEKGDPKGYVILLEGEAASRLLGPGTSRGLLVIPVADAEVRTVAPGASIPLPSGVASDPLDATADVLVLKENMAKLARGWARKAPRAEDEDPAAW